MKTALWGSLLAIVALLSPASAFMMTHHHGGGGGGVLQSIALSGTTFTSGSPTATYIGTLSAALSPATPVFSGTYSLVSSGGTCSSGDTTHFQIASDALKTLGTPAAGTYTVCVKATQGGSLTTGFTVTAGNLINANTFCAANGGGTGTVGSPWKSTCIQAAVNAAVAGDTVFLAAGVWQLSTADAAPVLITKKVSLIGAGSGNTFDAWGHINNPGPADMCEPTLQAGVTCIVTAGTAIENYGTFNGGGSIPPGGGAGYIQFGVFNQVEGGETYCANISVSHIFFDSRLSSEGGGLWGTLNFEDCPGPVTVNDIRFLTYDLESNCPTYPPTWCSGESPFYPNYTDNFVVQNTIFAEPLTPEGVYALDQGFQEDNGVSHLIQNVIFWQLLFNPIYEDSETMTGTQHYLYVDATGSGVQHDASVGWAGCAVGPSRPCLQNGGTAGSLHVFATNNLFWSSGSSPQNMGFGGGVNDPTSSGGESDVNLTGNWVFGSTAALDSCQWHIFADEGNCLNGNVIGMGMNTAFSSTCVESNNGMGFNITNNSIVATTSAQINGRGNPAVQGQSLPCWEPSGGNTTCDSASRCVNVALQVYGLNAQKNYLSSPSNQYLTNAQTISPTQTNNFCTPAAGSVTGCATSGFATAPTASMTIGNLQVDPVTGLKEVPFTATGFTAQYGAVQWLASTSSTTPTSADARWSSNNGSFPNSAADSYVPPVYLSGVDHGNTVYLWVMDSANHISATASALIP